MCRVYPLGGLRSDARNVEPVLFDNKFDGEGLEHVVNAGVDVLPSEPIHHFVAVSVGVCISNSPDSGM